MRGISHTGMEMLSNVVTRAGDVNRSAWSTPVRTRPGRFHVPLAKGNFDMAAHVSTSLTLVQSEAGSCQPVWRTLDAVLNILGRCRMVRGVECPPTVSVASWRSAGRGTA